MNDLDKVVIKFLIGEDINISETENTITINDYTSNFKDRKAVVAYIIIREALNGNWHIPKSFLEEYPNIPLRKEIE